MTIVLAVIFGPIIIAFSLGLIAIGLFAARLAWEGIILAITTKI